MVAGLLNVPQSPWPRTAVPIHPQPAPPQNLEPAASNVLAKNEELLPSSGVIRYLRLSEVLELTAD